MNYIFSDLKNVNFAWKILTKFCEIWSYNSYNEVFSLKKAKFLLFNHYIIFLYNKVTDWIHVYIALKICNNFAKLWLYNAFNKVRKFLITNGTLITSFSFKCMTLIWCTINVSISSFFSLTNIVLIFFSVLLFQVRDSTKLGRILNSTWNNSEFEQIYQSRNLSLNSNLTKFDHWI